MKLSRLCSCGRIVKGRCEICQQAKAAKADDYRERDRYPKGWDELSRLYRAEHPLCENCMSFDRATPASEVHHIKPVRKWPELALDASNLIAVCRQCHEILERETVR